MRNAMRPAMDRYFFHLQGAREVGEDNAGTLLPNDAAAEMYARRIIRELKQGGGYDKPGLAMIVKNEAGRHIASIPFAECIVSGEPRAEIKH
jgi:hypothetical protein